jgi:hypothetical protein
MTGGEIPESATHCRLDCLNSVSFLPSAERIWAGCSDDALRMLLMLGVKGIRITT